MDFSAFFIISFFGVSKNFLAFGLFLGSISFFTVTTSIFIFGFFCG
tara:strand:+ start:5003 stop:5140 length:138 start_codon:yes stop_codon:yes gene_type:complete